MNAGAVEWAQVKNTVLILKSCKRLWGLENPKGDYGYEGTEKL
jgi:hypothetical protein